MRQPLQHGVQAPHGALGAVKLVAIEDELDSPKGQGAQAGLPAQAGHHPMAHAHVALQAKALEALHAAVGAGRGRMRRLMWLGGVALGVGGIAAELINPQHGAGGIDGEPSCLQILISSCWHHLVLHARPLHASRPCPVLHSSYSSFICHLWSKVMVGAP